MPNIYNAYIHYAVQQIHNQNEYTIQFHFIVQYACGKEGMALPELLMLLMAAKKPQLRIAGWSCYP